jgi:Uncharacterised nucleotidyltransferase
MFNLIVLDAAEQDLKSLDKPVAKRIGKRIKWLAENPEHIKPEPLTGNGRAFSNFERVTIAWSTKSFTTNGSSWFTAPGIAVKSTQKNEYGIPQRCVVGVTFLRCVLRLGQRAHQLAPEDALIQLAVHTFVNHQMSLPALRSLMDITFLARHQPLDWSVIVQRAHEWRITTATWLVLKLAAELTGLDEAATVVKQLSPSRVRQWLIRLFANSKSLIDMRDLSRGRLRFLYLLLLVDRKRDMLKLIGRTLWPEREWLTARYGRASAKMHILHLFNVVRGKI